jgi:hypothetical protein
MSTDPLNPRRAGVQLLEEILRQNPHLSRETVLKVAACAGFDLLDLRLAQPRDPRDTSRA